MAALDVPYDVTFIEANGLSFETAVMGDGPKLALCLHGFPETHFSWRYQMPLLAKAGYTVWAPNMRGYGQSSRPPRVADYRLPHLLDDVAGLMDAAQARGIQPSLLVAHDWGGIIAWSFVLRQIRPVERFVAINIPHLGVMAQKGRSLKQMRKSWYVALFQLPWLPEWGLTRNKGAALDRIFIDTVCNKTRFPKHVRDVFRENALIPGCARAMVNYYRANFGHADMRAFATEPLSTDIPTLMIWGEEDVALGKELTVGTDEFVSDLTMAYLPGVSHWAQQDAPEAVNAALEAWLVR